MQTLKASALVEISTEFQITSRISIINHDYLSIQEYSKAVKAIPVHQLYT